MPPLLSKTNAVKTDKLIQLLELSLHSHLMINSTVLETLHIPLQQPVLLSSFRHRPNPAIAHKGRDLQVGSLPEKARSHSNSSLNSSEERQMARTPPHPYLHQLESLEDSSLSGLGSPRLPITTHFPEAGESALCVEILY